MDSKRNNALVLNLKGQISRVLSTQVHILREEEKGGLEGVCNAIDCFILSEREKTDLGCLQDELQLSLKFLKCTRKDSIKKRIIPALEKVLKVLGNE